MKTEETTPTWKAEWKQPERQGRDWQDFFISFFFYKDNFYLLNKILLSSVPVLFTL